MKNNLKATELRIGNLLLFNDFIEQVSSIHYDNTIRLRKNKNTDVCHGCYDIYDIRIQPIPLTAEQLLKLGFEALYENYYIKYIAFYEFTYYYCSSGGCWKFELNGDRIDINFVHQLQNLYFALTGTELELNDN